MRRATAVVLAHLLRPPFEAVRVVNAESRSREESLEECVAELHEALQLYEQDAQMPGAIKHGDQEAQVRAPAASKSPCSAIISQLQPSLGTGPCITVELTLRVARWRRPRRMLSRAERACVSAVRAMDGSQLLRQQLADSQQTVRSLRAEVGQTAELLAELAHARTCNMKTEAELVAARSRLARFEHGDHVRELQGQVDLALRHNLVVSDRLSAASVLSSPTAGGRSSEEERLQREVQQLRGELQGALDAAISRASAKGESTAMLTVESVGKQAELSAVMARNSALEAEVAVLQQRDRQTQQLIRELKHEMTMMEKLPLELQALMQRADRAEQV
jgi:hypothetical protein